MQIKKLFLDNSQSTTSIAGLLDEFVNLTVLSMNNVGLTSLKGFPRLPNLIKVKIILLVCWLNVHVACSIVYHIFINIIYTYVYSHILIRNMVSYIAIIPVCIRWSISYFSGICNTVFAALLCNSHCYSKILEDYVQTYNIYYQAQIER